MEKTKKIVLKISSGYIVFFTSAFFISEYCHSSWCRIREDEPIGFMLFILLPFLPIFFLSLITYKMRDEVFRVWWSFARWWVPVIVFSTLFLSVSGASGGGGWGLASGLLEFVVLWLLYIIFVVVSLIQIVRAYLRK